MEKVKTAACPYNVMVECSEEGARCSTCGWNAAVAEERKVRIDQGGPRALVRKGT